MRKRLPRLLSCDERAWYKQQTLWVALRLGRLNDDDGGGGVSISGLKLSATAAMSPLAACDAVGDVDEDATSGLQLPSTRSHHHRLHRSGTLDATVTMTISFQNRHEHLIFAVLVCPAALIDASKHALIDCADDCECSILFTEYFRNLR